MLYIYYNLIIHRHGLHRNLHSFPTRRSSDLEQALRRRLVADDLLARQRDQRAVGVEHGQLLADPAGVRGDRDRKSTRLNSSHPSISYAVFCLKKKKKMNTKLITYS